MTDPVDTDALRAMAAAGDYNMGPFAVAAADEVDRLREAQGGEAWFHKAMEARTERNRLRTVIENAPHAAECEQWDLEPRTGHALSEHCTCWKAGVL